MVPPENSIPKEERMRNWKWDQRITGDRGGKKSNVSQEFAALKEENAREKVVFWSQENEWENYSFWAKLVCYQKTKRENEQCL